MMRKALGRSLVILASGELLTRGLSAVAFAYLARVLGPESFGKLEFALSCILFGTILIEAGFATIGARNIAITPVSADPLLSRILPLQMCIAVIAVLGSSVVKVLNFPDSLTASLLLGYSFSLLMLPFLLTWVFQGQQRMLWVAAPQVLRQVFFLAASLLLVRSAADILWLPSAEILGLLAAGILSLAVYLRKRETLSLESPVSSESVSLAGEAASIGVSQILWFFRMYLPILLLKFVLDDEAVGRFGAANRMVSVFQAVVPVYWMGFFPLLSRQRGALQRTLIKSVLGSMVVVCLAAGVLSAIGPYVMELVFGPEFAASSAGIVFVLLVWRVPALMFRSHAERALFVAGRQNLELICSLISLLPLVPAIYYAVKYYGLEGLAAAAVAVELIGGVVTWAAWLYVSSRGRSGASAAL